jgi:two-component system, chemotaxis family, protein-glutamate methylesterase/glutaminase
LIGPKERISLIIVQHMSKYFTELFAERLDRVTEYTVREAKDGDIPTPGTALIVPGGMYLAGAIGDEGESLPTFIVKEQEELHETVIDKTMETIALMYSGDVCGVLLSGMGADGAVGMLRIREHGGHTIVQDPEDAAVASMPRSAIDYSAVEKVLPAEEIPVSIRELIGE